MAGIASVIIDILSKNFNAHDIAYVAKEVDRNFDIYDVSGYPKHHNFFARDAADIVVRYFRGTNKFKDLINFLLAINNSQYRGKVVVIDNVNLLNKELQKNGLEYVKEEKNVFLSEKGGLRNDFGICREGEEYSFAFIRISFIAKSNLSSLTTPDKVMDAYNRFITYLQKGVEKRGGRLWSFSNEGGLCAFYGDEQCARAAATAYELSSGIYLFNAEQNPIPYDFSAAFALHYGKCVYREPTVNIISEEINFVSHLAGKYAQPGSVSCSDVIYQNLGERLNRNFMMDGIFEGRKVFRFIFPANCI